METKLANEGKNSDQLAEQWKILSPEEEKKREAIERVFSDYVDRVASKDEDESLKYERAYDLVESKIEALSELKHSGVPYNLMTKQWLSDITSIPKEEMAEGLQEARNRSQETVFAILRAGIIAEEGPEDVPQEIKDAVSSDKKESVVNICDEKNNEVLGRLIQEGAYALLMRAQWHKNDADSKKWQQENPDQEIPQ